VPLVFAGIALLLAAWRRRRQAAIAMLQRDKEMAASGAAEP